MLKNGQAYFQNLSVFTAQDFRVCFQSAFTCLKLTIETLEQGVKYVQS